MYDIELHMTNEPGQLALMGETLGAAGISVEGGGMWVHDGVGVAHFLVADGEAGAAALTGAGLVVAAVRQVSLQRLDQDKPGQLGALCRAMADAGVNIQVLYSDHDHQLVVVGDDPETCAQVSAEWTRSAEH